MSIPIVFIHAGDDDYLTYSLTQAKRSNPSSDIILLGDQANAWRASESVRHYMLEDYCGGAVDFARVYVHLSPNTYEYELFCFQRWYILRDFMRQHGIGQSWYLDSDLMLYTDVDNPEFLSFTNIWTMLTYNTLQTLSDFCELMRRHYCDPGLLEALQAYTARHEFPGVSDMVFSRLFVDTFPQFANHRNGAFQDSFFDGNIRHPMRFPPYEDDDEVEMQDGMKKVYWLKGCFYAKLASGKMVKINGQHFQGDCKSLMVHFMNPGSYTGDQAYYFDYGSCQWLPV